MEITSHSVADKKIVVKPCVAEADYNPIHAFLAAPVLFWLDDHRIVLVFL